MATLTELYNLRTNSDLRNRVEVAADQWVLAQASRQAEPEPLAKYQSLAYDAMVAPADTSARLMRMIPLAAEQQQLDITSDAALTVLVSALMDRYALTRPTTPE